jgi:DnaJ-class molecular chaperone
VVVRAGPNSQQSGDLYVLLGISPTATKAEIKSAYKKAALKWHPDVNKAADATSRFNDVKNAYQTLADADTRRRYDTLRNSGGGGGSTSGWGSNPFGSGGGRSERNPTGSSSSSTSSSRSQKPDDPFYGFSDFWADMEKEFGEFESQRPKNAKPRSLWEELEALGEEFVDFLEEAAPEVSASGFDIFGNKTSSSAKSSTKKDGRSSSRSGTSSGTSTRSSTSGTSTRSSTSGTSTSSSSSSTSSGTSTSGAYSKPWNSSSASAAKQKKTESVDEMLEKLKRDMGMK